jgi:phage head maturation protease
MTIKLDNLDEDKENKGWMKVDFEAQKDKPKETVKKYEPDTTDEALQNPIGAEEYVEYMPGEAMHKAIETVGLIQQFLIRKKLPRVEPEGDMHRHVGYDEPHPEDQTHWGEEASDVPLEGPFSVSEFLGSHPREILPGYGNTHEHYFKLLQTYLDLANPDKDVTDNQLKIIAINLRPRTMKCSDDVRQRYLSADREIRDIDKIGGSKQDTEALELKRANAGKIFSVLDDVSSDLEDASDRVQIAMAIDKIISLEVSRPEGWYLCELFGITDCEPVREATVQIMDRLKEQNKLELGFVGIHHIVTGDYLIKSNSAIVTNDTPLFNGMKERAFVIEKQAKKPVVIAGYASPVVRDKDGHRIPLQALRPAFKKFMANPQFRNVMIKHRNAQVGVVVPEYTDAQGNKWESQVDDIGLFVVCILRDDVKIARDVADMIRKGILRSFSIGGEALARKYVCQNSNSSGESQCWWDVTDLELHEITICEEGKNQAAKFILLKGEI